jgi:hypothetical protein
VTMKFDTYIEKILADLKNCDEDHISPQEIYEAEKEIENFKKPGIVYAEGGVMQEVVRGNIITLDFDVLMDNVCPYCRGETYDDDYCRNCDVGWNDMSVENAIDKILENEK